MIPGRSDAPAPLQQALELARTDPRLEARAGEALVTAPFGVVVLLLVPLAVGTDVPMCVRSGPACTGSSSCSSAC